MYVGTNWKMNKSCAEARQFASVLRDRLNPSVFSTVSVFVIPPVTALTQVLQLKEFGVRLGVQNIFWEASGAYTGEISAIQAVDAGASVIEIGHSERREMFGETDYTVARKVKAAVDAGATALICVGETWDVYQTGRFVPFVQGQTAIATSLVTASQLSNVWIAYEPTWAIGEGSDPAQPHDVRDVHRGIRQELEYRFGHKGSGVPILYGGSVDGSNATEFLSIDDVDGLFVGRYALDPERFVETIEVVNRYVANYAGTA